MQPRIQELVPDENFENMKKAGQNDLVARGTYGTAPTFDNDTLELIKSTLLYVVDFFRLVIPSLLVVFVPQRCFDENVIRFVNGVQFDGEERACTFRENITSDDLTAFKKGVIILNFITLGLFLSQAFVVGIREKKLIEYLDFSETATYANLPSELARPRYHHIGKWLTAWHRRVYILGILSCVFFVANSICSAVVVFRAPYYLDQTTIIGFLTNVALVGGKIYTQTRQAHIGLTKKLALSLSVVMPMSYNVIDPDYVVKDPVEQQQPAGGDNGDVQLTDIASVPLEQSRPLARLPTFNPQSQAQFTELQNSFPVAPPPGSEVYMQQSAPYMYEPVVRG